MKAISRGWFGCLALAVVVALPAWAQEAHVGNLTGHSASGKKIYRRYCVGCHGPLGDGNGENAPWIDPKPRDFVAATFKCRSTPTGTLPTDQDLFNSVGRGFTNSNMPHWDPLPAQDRIDLVAYIKTFSPRWQSEKPGDPIKVPPEPAVTTQSIVHGGELFQKMECWKCHGQQGRGDGPSAATLTDSKDQPIRPYNFADATDDSRFKCGTTNADLYRIFMTGLDGTPMPSFADNVKPNEAWDLVFYLRTLQPINSKAKQIAKQLGLKPINPDAGPGAQAPEKAETEPAPSASQASLPSAPAQTPEAPATPTESKPSAAPPVGTAEGAGAANPAPAQPAGAQAAWEPKSGAAAPARTGEAAAAANPVTVPLPGSQPAGESKPAGVGVPASGGTEGTKSAVNQAANVPPVDPASGPSRNSPPIHTAHRIPTIGKPRRVELRNLAVGDEGGRLSVTLMLSGAVAPQLNRLESPPRVVVDLPNTVTVLPQNRIAVGKGGAKAVRVGMDGQVPPTTRVVVDLTRPLAYQMVPGSDNSWILELHDDNKMSRK